MFPIPERIEIIFTYGECGRSIIRTLHSLQNKYPLRAGAFTKKKVRSIVRLFQDTGSVRELPRIRTSQLRDPALQQRVLQQAENNPHVGTRGIAADLGLNQTCVSRILARNKFHPYKIILQQELHGDDFQKRMDFCNFVQNHPNIYDRILFSDEATFRSDGIVNRHNMHYWSRHNPHWIRRVDHQRVWSLNVWGGIKDGRLFGPHFFDGTLNGHKYLEFVQGECAEYIEGLPLAESADLIYQHDGAPPHYHRDVVAYLNNNANFDS